MKLNDFEVRESRGSLTKDWNNKIKYYYIPNKFLVFSPICRVSHIF